MKRYSFLLLAFLASNAFAAQTLYFPAGVTTETIKSSTVRIVYDIHGVLAQPKTTSTLIKRMLTAVVGPISNAYHPMPGMETVIKDLGNRGYQQQIASNIGARSFIKLKAKFANKKHNSALFTMLKPGKVFGTQASIPLTFGITLTELTIHLKPSPLFFADFNKTYNITINDIVIFIDDILENIKEAVKAGWIGIHFTSVAQVRSDLAKLGLLPF